jgi:hypothetical protein
LWVKRERDFFFFLVRDRCLTRNNEGMKIIKQKGLQLQVGEYRHRLPPHWLFYFGHGAHMTWWRSGWQTLNFLLVNISFSPIGHLISDYLILNHSPSTIPFPIIYLIYCRKLKNWFYLWWWGDNRLSLIYFIA